MFDCCLICFNIIAKRSTLVAYVEFAVVDVPTGEIERGQNLSTRVVNVFARKHDTDGDEAQEVPQLLRQR